MQDVSRKMARGAVWMVLFRLLDRSFGLVSMMVLARLLIPADFGLIAMAMSIIAVIAVLTTFSFDIALIQKSEPQRSHFDTAWTLNIIFAALSAVILLLLASPAAKFYEEPRLEALIFVLAGSSLVKGFENIGVVWFRKEMEFDKEFKFLFAKRLARFVVTLPLALTLGNYWALALGILIGNAAGVALSFVMNTYRPKFSLATWQELFHFSKWLLANNFITLLYVRTADFVIGKMLGAHALGLFQIANEISQMPSRELVAPVNRALFPGYVKLSSDLGELRQTFVNVISLIVLCLLPAVLGITVTADLLVRVALGPKWIEAAPLIQILAIYAFINLVYTTSSTIYLGLGRPKIITVLSLMHLVVQIPLIFWFISEMGVIGGAWAYLATSLILLPIICLFISRIIGLPILELTSVLWRPTIACSVMTGLVFLYLEQVGISDKILGQILDLLVAVLIGVVSYIATLIGLWSLSPKRNEVERIVLKNSMRILRQIFYRYRKP